MISSRSHILPFCKRSLISIRFTHTYELRDYQEDAISKVLDASKRGIKRQAVVMATGGGKTVVFSHLIPLLPGKGTKTLVLAHTQELINQSRNMISKVNPHMKVGVEMGKLRSDVDDEVIIASVSSLARMNRFEKLDPSDVKTIIIDECHHATAASYRKIFKYFRADHKDTDVNVIGFTATLHRLDEMSLGTVFDEIVYERPLKAMIENGELCDFVISEAMVEGLNLAGIQVRKGDYDTSDLYDALSEVDINQKILLSYMKMIDSGKYQSTLIFCVSIEHCYELCGLFQSQGINAQYVTGKTTKSERVDIVEDFRNGKIPILCNVGVFTEGTDIPSVDSIILARPTLSNTLKIQMIGRGLRNYPGKTHCHVVDLVGVTQGGLNIQSSLHGVKPDTVIAPKRQNSAEMDDDKDELIKIMSLKSIQEKRDLIVKKVLGLHRHGSMTFETRNGLKIFEVAMLDIEVIKGIFMKGPFPWVLLKNSTGLSRNGENRPCIWGLSAGYSEFFLVKMIKDGKSPLFKLTHNRYLINQDHEEIGEVLTTNDVFALFDILKEKYPEQVKFAQNTKSFRRKATFRQVDYILSALESKIEHHSRVSEQDRDVLTDCVKQVLTNEPYVLSSNMIFALRYSKSSYYPMLKSKQILYKATKKYMKEYVSG